GVLEDHGEVVEDVAELRAGAHLPAAGAAGPQGVLVLHGPGHLVQAVDVLLDDVVAGQPGEVQPVTQLPLHVGPPGLAVLMPQLAGVIDTVQGDDIADGAVVDALDGLALGVLVAVAQPGDDGQ